MEHIVIDTTALIRLQNAIGGDADDLAEFIDDFSEIAPDLLVQMQSASGNRDWKAVKIAAHSLKSNARDLGANDLGELCLLLEQQASQEEVTDINTQLSAIENTMNAYIKALRELDLNNL